MEKSETVEEVARRLRPSVPVYFLRDESLKKSVDCFLKNFKSKKFSTKILYSVKSNPDVEVLSLLHDNGIVNFDVASLHEIQLVNSLFKKDSFSNYFMHPIKSRESIFSAYYSSGIRDYSLDSIDELNKILEVTNNARDLNLHVRLAVSNKHSHIDLSGKFGGSISETKELLRQCRRVSNKLGICFHVGSQCMDPTDYKNVIETIKTIIEETNIDLDVVDVGGGFPSIYPTMIPQDLSVYFKEIFDAIDTLPLKDSCEIWCEPGRALAAECTSLVVRVEGRKNNSLHINDGTYGGLFDAGYPGLVYPVKAIRINGKFSDNNLEYKLFGPTCDSLDTMNGPFLLPEDIKEGDYIEIGQLGSYSKSIRTNFNGFEKCYTIKTADKPLMSMYK